MFSQSLLSEGELKESLEIADDRNLSVHTYDEDFAEKVARRIIAHFDVMQKIVKRIEF